MDSNMVITDFKSAANLNRKFDLIIYDEINSLPLHDNDEIIKLLNGLSEKNGKIIAYSVEQIYKDKNEILLPVRDRNVPMIEPRDIITRIDINKDIPYMVYDYLKWSINNSRNVIIYVPSRDKVEKVFNYMNRYSWDKACNISYFIKDITEIKVMLNFYKRKKTIMITNEFNIAPANLSNTDIMVYFADDTVFSHKILTHICSRVRRAERDSRGEAILVYNEKSSNIETATGIARKFNKEAWEMGLLKL
jgi:late competence protein required for DNA uptake (superfamily II DNA/RNA helicase)